MNCTSDKSLTEEKTAFGRFSFLLFGEGEG